MLENNVQNESVHSNDRFDVYLVSKKLDRVFIVDRDRCKGCKICVAVCPYDAIFMSTDKKTKNGHAFPVENTKCKACKKCLYACPDFALSIYKLDEVEIKEEEK